MPNITNPFFLAFVFLTITNLAIVIGHYWTKMRKAALDAELKAEMIRRGLTPDEIRETLAAMSGLRPLSENVKQIAADPNRKIEAIKAYRNETGASLSEAKKAVEEFAASRTQEPM